MELSKKQKKVMDELFEAAEDEAIVLDNNNVSRDVFNNWLTEDSWIREFDRRIEESRRRAQIIITQFQAAAAIKLVELTSGKSEETARKACLDIIQMPRIIKEAILKGGDELLKVSEETAEEILILLAKDGKKTRHKKPESS